MQMKIIRQVDLPDKVYWAMRKKKAELECKTWREFFIMISGVDLTDVEIKPPKKIPAKLVVPEEVSKSELEEVAQKSLEGLFHVGEH